MSDTQLIHHFATALIESAERHNVELPAEIRSMAAPNLRLTGRHLATIARALGAELDDVFFGLASAPCPHKSSTFGFELMTLSNTLGEALERYFRFYDILTDGLQLSLEQEDDSARVIITVADSSRDPRNILPEWYTVRLLAQAQWLIGEDIELTHVEFAHQRQLPQNAYEGTFGKQLRFGAPSNLVVFPRRFLNRRVVRDINDLGVLAASEDLRGTSLGSKMWRNIVGSSLKSRLYNVKPIPPMEEIAREFGVSGQTLRRGLKNEGTSYRQVKADARLQIVLDNISDTSMPLSQISLLAGFAETNGLIRAMKTWTGLSPSAFRRVAIDGVEAGGDETDAGREHDIADTDD